jgi:hypothetical protein
MDPITHRKNAFISTNAGVKRGIPVERPPVKYDALPDKSSNSSSSLASKEPEFRHAFSIGLALLPPVAIILAFGGRPSLIALCFGFLTTYILDLIGTLEVFFCMIYG